MYSMNQNTRQQHSADRNMLKNEIHDIVISSENIKEARTELTKIYNSKIVELNRQEHNFIVKLSNL